jgi:hypothetical protein
VGCGGVWRLGRPKKGQSVSFLHFGKCYACDGCDGFLAMRAYLLRVCRPAIILYNYGLRIVYGRSTIPLLTKGKLAAVPKVKANGLPFQDSY